MAEDLESRPVRARRVSTLVCVQVSTRVTMKSPQRKSMPAPTPRLTREDWLDAGFAAAVEGGFGNVRVLTLAHALGVTRGSFYWHFEDHAALVAGLVERWIAQQLALAGELAAPDSTDPHADLERVLDRAVAQLGPALEQMRFELALRDHGRKDAAVAQALAEVDRARLQVFEQKFLRLTGDAQTAGELAIVFYLAIVGSHLTLSRPTNPPQLRQYLKGLILKYLVQAQQPAPTKSRRARR